MTDTVGYPTTVLFVSHDAHLGGAQLAMVDTAAALVGAGIKVHVLIPPDPTDGNLSQRVALVGAHVHTGAVGPWARSPGGPAVSRKRAARAIALGIASVMRVARRVRAEVIITNTGLLVGPAVAALGSRRSHVWWLHERWDREEPIPMLLGRRVSRSVIRRTGDVIVPSNSLAEEWRSTVGADRLHVVPPTVALSERLPTAELAFAAEATPKRLLFPGGLLTVKRPLEAVKAFAIAKQSIPELSLEIVGHGNSERGGVEREVSRLGLEGSVVLRGFTPDLTGEMRPGTALISCGVSETFGRVLVEAMAAGVPVVAAAAGATPEVVTDGASGLLYTPGDPAGLAAALIELDRNPDLRRSIVERAHDEAHRRWLPSAHADSVISVLSALRPSHRR